MLKGRQLTISALYEFLGEIEQKGHIYLKARVLKESSETHNKVVYEYTTNEIAKIMDSIFARKKEVKPQMPPTQIKFVKKQEPPSSKEVTEKDIAALA